MKVSALGVEEQRVNVIIDLDDPKQASELGDGYRVEVNVIVWERENVVKAPTSALFRHGDGWAVFRVEGSRARRTPVTVGQRSAVQAEIRSGLSPGDRVIVFPSGDVEDGAAVQAR
jgi:HlyD family secretion protein